MASIDSATPPFRRLIDADEVASKLSWSRRQTFRAADSGLMQPGLRLGRLRRFVVARPAVPQSGQDVAHRSYRDRARTAAANASPR